MNSNWNYDRAKDHGAGFGETCNRHGSCDTRAPPAADPMPATSLPLSSIGRRSRLRFCGNWRRVPRPSGDWHTGGTGLRCALGCVERPWAHP
jgi:hypothetical protein